MKKRSVYTLFMSLVVGLVLTGCGNKESGGETAGNDKDVLKVGMEAAYAPFNWTQLDDSNGGVPIQENEEFAGGYDVEIAKKIADGLGKELVIISYFTTLGNIINKSGFISIVIQNAIQSSIIISCPNFIFSVL